MSSQPGDSVGQGRSYSFSAAGDGIELASHAGKHAVNVLARPAGTNDVWSARFAAPAGASLVPGVYGDARPFEDETHPGLEVGGAGRGCIATTGQFTVLEANYGPYGYVESVHLTFEQHCEGAAPALRGEINLVGSPPPAPLQVHLTVDNTSVYNRTDGSIELQGTVACSQAVDNAIKGRVSEATKKGRAFADVSLMPTCAPAPTRWNINLLSANSKPFLPGKLRVILKLRAADPYYTVYNNYDPIIYATEAVSTSVTATAGGCTCASCGGALSTKAAAVAEPAALVGTWNNCDSATRGLVKLVIAASGSGLTVDAFGACHPDACDWGKVPALTYAADVDSHAAVAFSAHYTFSFKVTILTGVLDSGSLRVEDFNRFTDTSGRSDYYFKDYFYKVPG